MKNRPLMLVLLAMPISTVLEVCQKYLYNDWDFLLWLAILVVLDTILGVAKHYKAKDISSAAYSRITKKILVYMAVLIVSNVAFRLTIQGEPIEQFGWLGKTCCIALILREMLSILENVEALFPGFVPKKIITHLKEFDSKTGKKIDN